MALVKKDRNKIFFIKINTLVIVLLSESSALAEVMGFIVVLVSLSVVPPLWC